MVLKLDYRNQMMGAEKGLGKKNRLFEDQNVMCFT